LITLAKVRRAQGATGAFVAALLLACAACGSDSDRKPLFPAEGKVFFESKPASGAIVFLHAADAEGPKAVRPHGTVGKDGSYRLSTYQNEDGVPAGTYQVAVFWTKPGKYGDEGGERLLPEKYANPAGSGIPPVVITEGANQLPAITLTK